jgi:hypothetical protein
MLTYALSYFTTVRFDTGWTFPLQSEDSKPDMNSVERKRKRYIEINHSTSDGINAHQGQKYKSPGVAFEI